LRLRGGHGLAGLLFLAALVLTSSPNRGAETAPGASISGVVVGPDGLPLAGVAVHVRRQIRARGAPWPATRATFDYEFSAPSTLSSEAPVVHTDKQGRFVVGGLESGVRYEVRARPAPPALGRVRAAEARLHAQPELRLPVEAGRTVSGRLVDGLAWLGHGRPSDRQRDVAGPRRVGKRAHRGRLRDSTRWTVYLCRTPRGHDLGPCAVPGRTRSDRLCARHLGSLARVRAREAPRSPAELKTRPAIPLLGRACWSGPEPA